MDKLEEIDFINEKDLESEQKLIQFARDKDEEVRYKAIEKLYPFSSSPNTRDLLLERLSDQDELVKVAALEILEEWGDPFAVEQIKICLNDSEWLVRGSAALAFARIEGQRAGPTLIEKLEATDNTEEKVRLLASLYISGSLEYLYDLIELLNDESYRVRCATANILVLCLTYNYSFEFCKKSLNVLKKTLEKEKTEAARSSIKNAINEIEEKYSANKS